MNRKNSHTLFSIRIFGKFPLLLGQSVEDHTRGAHTLEECNLARGINRLTGLVGS